jgi:hypothetical protein
MMTVVECREDCKGVRQRRAKGKNETSSRGFPSKIGALNVRVGSIDEGEHSNSPIIPHHRFYQTI